jgi:hypothetical protein
METTEKCFDCRKDFHPMNLHCINISPWTGIKVCDECEAKYKRRTILYPKEEKVWVKDGSEEDKMYKQGNSFMGWYKEED